MLPAELKQKVTTYQAQAQKLEGEREALRTELQAALNTEIAPQLREALPNGYSLNSISVTSSPESRTVPDRFSAIVSVDSEKTREIKGRLEQQFIPQIAAYGIAQARFIIIANPSLLDDLR
ncbi:MAG: hypothetical protein ABIH92_00130 [Nanoarchaeota archaeon]